MCFILHIASKVPLPLVPWDEAAPGFNVQPVAEWGKTALGHLNLPHVYELGSDTSCGCGFRHVSYQGQSWPEEEWRPEEQTLEAQPNHEQMVAFLRSHLPRGEEFELYGGWDGELDLECRSNQEILLSRLLALDFSFRHRGHYRVTVD